jgi:hypothetical protein
MNDDLDKSVAFLYKALSLSSVSRLGWAALAGSLAGALLTRFNHRGNDKDLDEASRLYEEVLDSIPVHDLVVDRRRALTNVACALYTRCKHRGIDKAIMLYREALICHQSATRIGLCHCITL